MTVGTSSWDGLGMGLNGEYEMTQVVAATDFLTMSGATSMSGDFIVLRDVDDTELMWVNSKGSIYSRAEGDTSGNAYVGIDCRGNSAAGGTAGFVATSGFRLTDYSDETGGWQLYPGLFYFVGTSCAQMTGGRVAGITIQFALATEYGGVSNTNTSFINFSDSNNQKVPSLFTFPGMTSAASLIFDANVTTASTHSLKIHIGDQGSSAGAGAYYIMLTSCVPS